jgi:hypothetical protein
LVKIPFIRDSALLKKFLEFDKHETAEDATQKRHVSMLPNAFGGGSFNGRPSLANHNPFVKDFSSTLGAGKFDRRSVANTASTRDPFFEINSGADSRYQRD